MPPVTVLFKALTAARQPVRGRTVTGKLLGPNGWLTDHTGTIIVETATVSGDDGLVQLQLTPQTEIAATGTCYEIYIGDTWTRYYCVVPASGSPVQLADILVDPATLTPVPAETPSIWLTRAELGQPGGVAPLDDDGLIPPEHLPTGGGGAVDSVNGETGAVVLDAADVGAPPVTRQIIVGPGLAGGGILAANININLGSGTQASLGKADTAVQPGALAPVATTGTYADLTGKPSIPDSYDDLTGLVPTSALPALAVTEYLGAVASQAAMLALTGQQGDWCIRTDLGTTWIITGNNPTQLASWTALSYPAAPVTMVNGQVGTVELGKGDVGLGNVANLAPTNLPISTDQQAALDLKAPLTITDALDTRVDALEAAGSGGVKATSTTGRQTIQFGPAGTSGSWTLCPAAYRVTVHASVGDVLLWSPHLLATATSDAEFDVASVVSGAAARFYSSDTNVQASGGHGGLYMGPNYSRTLRAIEWTVTAADIASGNVTLALMYRASGAGNTLGSTLYVNHVDLINLGAPA